MKAYYYSQLTFTVAFSKMINIYRSLLSLKAVSNDCHINPFVHWEQGVASKVPLAVTINTFIQTQRPSFLGQPGTQYLVQGPFLTLTAWPTGAIEEYKGSNYGSLKKQTSQLGLCPLE